MEISRDASRYVRSRRCLRKATVVLALFTIHCGVQRGTIGARLGRDGEGHVVLREVPAGLGAKKAGLKPGDEVLLIAGQDVRELSEEGLHAVLSGERGSHIRLTVRRGNDVLRVVVERTEPKSSNISK